MSTPREQAARWFARMQRAQQDHPERARFEAWLAADPLHAAEYQAFADLWSDFSSTSRTQALADGMERQGSRRAFVRNGLAGLVLLLGGGLGWRSYRTSSFDEAFATVIAERRLESLRDGSSIYLDANTDLRVRYRGNQRLVELLRGQAIFDVRSAPDRPFVVEAGLGRITVLGTRFAVNRLEQSLRISVDHGRVQVNSPGGELVLGAGEVAEIGGDGKLQRLSLNAMNAFAFGGGHLVFEEADLSEIAASLSRYRLQPIRVAAGKASPRISAVVQLRDVEGFLQALPSIAPVALEQHGGVTWLQAR